MRGTPGYRAATLASTSAPPLLDTALVRRIEAAAARFHRLRLEGIAAREGNPRRVELYDGASFVAGASAARPDDPVLNRVVGLTTDDASAIAPVVSWYRRRGIWPWFEVTPAEGADTLLDALAAEGAWPVALAQVAVGVPATPEGAGAPEVTVEPVDGDTIGAFGATRAEGHHLVVEGDEQAEAAADVARWHQHSGMFPLLARVQGEAAGAALLYAHGGVALLADTSTLLAQRGRGVGPALLGERLRLAADLGCDVAAGAAGFGSSTHLGYQRAGLVAGYTRAILHLGG